MCIFLIPRKAHARSVNFIILQNGILPQCRFSFNQIGSYDSILIPQKQTSNCTWFLLGWMIFFLILRRQYFSFSIIHSNFQWYIITVLLQDIWWWSETKNTREVPKLEWHLYWSRNSEIRLLGRLLSWCQHINGYIFNFAIGLLIVMNRKKGCHSLLKNVFRREYLEFSAIRFTCLFTLFA